MSNSSKSFKIIAILLLSLLFPVSIYAFSYYSVESQNFDTNLTEEVELIYTNPTKIYVTHISTNAKELQRNPSKWVKTLYYYSITRLHLPDLPYSYLLDENGIIYQGATGAVGVNPQLREVDGAVTIAYISSSPILTNRASESLREMVEKISFNWGISQLSTVKLYINKEEGKLSTVTAQEISGDFSNAVKDALRDWEGYEEANLEYRARIEELIYDEEVEIGERLKVKIKIRNNNDFPWFTDRDPIYISTQDSIESDFAINQEWDSFSKPTNISDVTILPGETVEVEFNLDARITLGEASESFEIHKFEDQPFQDSDFEVKFDIVKGEKQLVEVSTARFDFVNIRDCRWYSCDILESADNGVVFILEEEESGWSKVKFGVDQSGWVNSAYLKKL